MTNAQRWRMQFREQNLIVDQRLMRNLMRIAVKSIQESVGFIRVLVAFLELLAVVRLLQVVLVFIIVRFWQIAHFDISRYRSALFDNVAPKRTRTDFHETDCQLLGFVRGDLIRTLFWIDLIEQCPIEQHIVIR